VLALAICACEPSLPQVAPTPTVTAVFDPAAARIPLPNDLVFIPPINSVCPAPANAKIAPTDPPMCAQAELLKIFNPTQGKLSGKFPSDQEVALTIEFTENTYENGRLKPIAPDLDFSTITATNLFVAGPTGVAGATGVIPLDPITADDYVMGVESGTLTLHNKNRAPWPPGRYTLVMRGGDMGVKTKAAIPVTASPVFDLVEQGKDMTLPENLGLLKAQNNGSTKDALEQGQQLNDLIMLYQLTAFPVADTVGKFPHQEMAITATFQIADTFTNVTVDPARGLAPLPFDLLRDPTSHKLTPTAACAFLSTKLDKTGNCPNPAAAGFLTLDGFSTTGAILAPTSALIDTTTVTSGTLKLYDLSDPRTPVEVTADPPTGALIREPCEFTAQFNGTTCDPARPALAPVLAFQPAGATSSDPSSVFRTRPLKDNTDYAVVLTNGIKDMAGKPIEPGTVARILRFTSPLFVGGHSALQGIDDITALSLDNMRKQIAQMFTALGTPNPTDVAMAYTFHTQSVLTPAVQLGALPYLKATAGLPGAATPHTRTDEFNKFGVPAGVPNTDIDEFIETTITTFDALDPATGAFIPDPTKAPTVTIPVLIATPLPANTPFCQGSTTLHCAPMMIFRHGLGRGRADMLLIANTFAKAGMATVAIDAAKHGDRTLCNTNPDPADPAAPISGCAPGSTCTSLLNAEHQGDPVHPGPPGTCSGDKYLKRSLDGAIVGTTAATDGIPVVSGNYLVSANFFRTRDTLRQDVIDQSQLVRVLAVPPTTVNHSVLTEMLGHGVIIDPTKIYFSGQSLGAIQGTLDVATNPRISKAGLNVGGGTIVDIFTNSPTFLGTEQNPGPTRRLLAGLGITPGTQQYLQFLTVAKTILDPADPANFAGHLTAHTLPDLLANPNGQVAQAPKQVLIQVANCDEVVPNPFGLVWSSNQAFATAVPQGPLPNTPAFFGGGTGTFQLFVGKDFNPADFGNPAKCSDTTAAGSLANGGGHGFLTNGLEHADLTGAAQSSMAAFMMAGTLPNSVVRAQ
jgi:hypothetical protein